MFRGIRSQHYAHRRATRTVAYRQCNATENKPSAAKMPSEFPVRRIARKRPFFPRMRSSRVQLFFGVRLKRKRPADAGLLSLIGCDARCDD